jgi:hypothetical protein
MTRLLDDDARRRTRGWIAAGFVTGLAISTHYYAVFTVVPLVILALAPGRDDIPLGARLRHLAISGAAAVAAFAVTSPFLFAEPTPAWRDVTANRAIVMDRLTESSGLFGSLGFYLSWLGRDALGVVSACLAAVGLFILPWFGWRRVVLVVSFPVTFLLFIGNTVPASRYLIPVVPFAALVGGVAVGQLISRGWRLAAVAALSVAAAEAGLASVAADVFFRQTDTRSLAADWIEANIPAGASVLVQPYSVVLRPTRAALEEAVVAHLGSIERAPVKVQQQLALDPYPAPAYRVIYLGSGGLDVDKIYLEPGELRGDAGWEHLLRSGIDYVVVKRFPTVDPALTGLDALLGRHARLDVTFSPYRDAGTPNDATPFIHGADTRITTALARPGPGIEIWQLTHRAVEDSAPR